MAYSRIDDSVVQAVLKAHDIVDTVGKYVQLGKHGKYMKGLCPFHSEKTPSFTVTPEKQIFYCYGCGKTGNSIKFIELVEQLTFPEAVRRMADEAHLVVNWGQAQSEPTAEDVERSTWYEAYERVAKVYHYLLMNAKPAQEALAYLRKRGLTDKLIDHFGIGYSLSEWDFIVNDLNKNGYDLASMSRAGLVRERQDGSGYFDLFRNRVMFPIRNSEGKTIAFAARALGDEMPKYLNSPESRLFLKSRQLYNFHAAKADIRKSRQVVLFEGYLDVIKAWTAGVTNGVASMGTALTAEHAAMLKRNADEAIICYDGDNAGIQATFKAITLLQQHQMQVKVALLPTGVDPDDYIEKFGPDAFREQIIRHAVPVVKFKLMQARKQYNLQDDDGLRSFLVEASKLLAELSSHVERDLYAQELAKEHQISVDALKADVHRVREQRVKAEPKWNTEWQPNRHSHLDKLSERLLPAYLVAERRLLARMFQDVELTAIVQERLADQFFEEDHAAIAAYLYSYYADGHDPDVTQFMSTLDDEPLQSTVARIVMEDDHSPLDEQMVDDYIGLILRMSLVSDIERLREQFQRATREGDDMEAARIGVELSTLERKLKQRLR